MNQTEIFYKIYLSFKGSRYLGWQAQKDFTPTVQGELNSVLATIFKTHQIHSTGSGRTDTGVHSLGHVVKVSAPFSIDHEALFKAFNSLLPNDIRVQKVESCEPNFLPTNHAIKKTYKYLFTNNEIGSPFQNDMIAILRL